MQNPRPTSRNVAQCGMPRFTTTRQLQRVAESSVLWSVTPTQTNSPYVRDLVRGIETEGWTVQPLTLRAALTTSHRLVHIQWPEHVSRGSGPVKTALKHVRAALLVGAFRLRGHKIVLTAHNRAPHGESNAIDAAFRRTVQRLARATIVLVPGHEPVLRQDGAIAQGSKVVAINHPIHRPDAPTGLAPTRDRDQLVILGQIHPYHRILEFVTALDSGQNQRPVVVVGSVGDPLLLDELESLAAQRSWLTIRPGFADEEILEPILANSRAMVSLQRNTFNSGGPFYALPRGLPIVLNQGPQADHLRSLVGEEWIFAIPDDVSTLDVDELDRWLNVERDLPDLGPFDVRKIAQEHVDLYELLRSG